MPSLRVPYSWLREYVQAPATVDEIAARLHMAGMEVDRVERVGGAWGDKVRVARIQKLEKHPNADKLQLATVEFGAAQPKTVVTGATNIAAGDVVPYGELGAEYVDGHTGERVVMKPKNMRGITSEGMILSAKELGLGEDHDGIMQLAKSLTVGVLLQDAIGDAVIVMEIAPNRPDALAILGIAREVAALYNVKLAEPPGAELRGKLDPSLLTVRIEDDRACPRFAAAYLDGIRIGPSPDWMQRRLAAAGMRPITNIVDITNYVMLEIGQPLHAYDATMLRGRVLIARKAKPGETLRTLDGKDRALRPEDLVIADGERALGLAGVMGGEDSEIRPDTTTVALEAASFEPLGIRRSSDAHGLQGSSGSAAARRFGLDLSPALVSLALARALSLMGEHAGGRLVGATDVYPHPRDVFRERVRDVLVGFGLQDTISYAAIDPAWLTKLTADGSPLAPAPLRITNPTTVSQSVMRPTLRGSLLDTASRNLRHREGVGLFEISPVYLPRKAELPEERWTVGILLAGQAEPVHEGETWLTSPRSWDLHDLRGITIGLRDAVGAGPVKVALQRGGPGLHPGRSLRIESDGRVVAVGGQLDPRVAAMWELPEHATFV